MIILHITGIATNAVFLKRDPSTLQMGIILRDINKVLSLLVLGFSLKFITRPPSFGLLMFHRLLCEILMPVVMNEE